MQIRQGAVINEVDLKLYKSDAPGTVANYLNVSEIQSKPVGLIS